MSFYVGPQLQINFFFLSFSGGGGEWEGLVKVNEKVTRGLVSYELRQLLLQLYV